MNKTATNHPDCHVSRSSRITDGLLRGVGYIARSPFPRISAAFVLGAGAGAYSAGVTPKYIAPLVAGGTTVSLLGMTSSKDSFLTRATMPIAYLMGFMAGAAATSAYLTHQVLHH